MRKLAAQKLAFGDSETVIIQLLGAAEFPLSLVYSHQAATMKKRGAPVDWMRTAQPIVTGLKPIGLSAKAQHPNAGKLFIDVALSKEGQELIKSFDRIPDRGDVTSDLKEGIKLYPADPRWGDTYAKHVEECREIFSSERLGSRKESHRGVTGVHGIFLFQTRGTLRFQRRCGEVSLVEVTRCTI
jgi:ABC-type Fe3+ transport system substrate-binding protein